MSAIVTCVVWWRVTPCSLVVGHQCVGELSIFLSPSRRRQPSSHDRRSPSTLRRGQPSSHDRRSPSTLRRRQPSSHDRRSPSTLRRGQPSSHDRRSPRTLRRGQPSSHDSVRPAPSEDGRFRPTTDDHPALSLVLSMENFRVAYFKCFRLMVWHKRYVEIRLLI